MLQNLYVNPQNSAKSADGSHLANVSDEEMQEHFDNFFEDVFVECETKVGGGTVQDGDDFLLARLMEEVAFSATCFEYIILVTCLPYVFLRFYYVFTSIDLVDFL